MSDLDYGEVIGTINGAALLTFLFIIGGLVAILSRRFILYRRAGWAIPTLLKRNLIFFGGLGGLIVESVVLRVVGGDLFTGDTLLRLLFVLHYDIIAIMLFAYYLKVEALDVNDPTGIPGPKGDTGEQGAQGEKGDKGDPGQDLRS